MADFDLEALSLNELKKMQKDIAKAISTFEDRQKAEARAKVEACLILKSALGLRESHCPPRDLWRAVAAVGSQQAWS
jgi:hypothetical protein